MAANQTKRNDETITIKLNKKQLKILIYVVLARLRTIPIAGTNNEYAVTYESPMDIKIVEGSSITYKTYYTKKCHAFGLICSSGEWLDDDTTFHERLVIGKNAKIKRYTTFIDPSGSFLM